MKITKHNLNYIGDIAGIKKYLLGYESERHIKLYSSKGYIKINVINGNESRDIQFDSFREAYTTACVLYDLAIFGI